MIKKLQQDPAKILSPSREEIMNMCQASFIDTLKTVDISGAFKRNDLTINLDGSEDHIVSNKVKLLV